MLQNTSNQMKSTVTLKLIYLGMKIVGSTCKVTTNKQYQSHFRHCKEEMLHIIPLNSSSFHTCSKYHSYLLCLVSSFIYSSLTLALPFKAWHITILHFMSTILTLLHRELLSQHFSPNDFPSVFCIHISLFPDFPLKWHLTCCHSRNRVVCAISKHCESFCSFGGKYVRAPRKQAEALSAHAAYKRMTYSIRGMFPWGVWECVF